MTMGTDIDFLARLEGQLETVAEPRKGRRAPRRRLTTAVAVSAVAIVAITAGLAGLSRVRGGGSGGDLAQPGPPIPSPDEGRAHVRLGPGPVDIPAVPVLTEIAADPSGRVWLSGRRPDDATGKEMGWVAYFEAGVWHDLSLPGQGLSGGAIAPIASDDVWLAVAGGFAHWDGASLGLTEVPFLDGDVGWTVDMDTTGPGDVWAVGHKQGMLYKSSDDGPGERTVGYLPVAMHFDGTSWNDPPVPDYPGRSSELLAVSTRDDAVWAVGFYTVKLGEREQSGGGLPRDVLRQGPIVVRWAGDRWAAVDVTGLGGDDLSLRDVVVLGPDDVWVLGSERLGGTKTTEVIAHWDGTGWSRIPSPDGVRRNDDHPSYRSIAATSDQDVWLAGDGRNGAGDAELAHWDGVTWDVLPVTDLDGLDARGQSVVSAGLADVVALGASDVWFNAAFTSYSSDDPEAAVPALAHWDGTSWRVVTMHP